VRESKGRAGGAATESSDRAGRGCGLRVGGTRDAVVSCCTPNVAISCWRDGLPRRSRVQAGVPISFIAMLARLLVLAGICMGRCLLAGRAGDVPRPRHRVPVRGRGCCGKPDAAYVFAAHLAASRPTSDLGTNRGLLVFLSFHVQTPVNAEVGGVRCRQGHGPRVVLSVTAIVWGT
jgi:hypothetical protein